MRIFNLLTNAFPIWVLTAALLSLWHPPLFVWFRGDLIPAGLAIIMLGMGLTLSPEDFRKILKAPARTASGFILQYTVMPFLGWSLSILFDLPAPFAAGLILVACCPGGTASNVVTYLAKADVALSVTMTAVSTLSAVVMTPLLTSWLAGSRVDVHFWGLLASTFQIVILPVFAGILLNRFARGITKKILPAAPLTAVIFITLIVASIVGQGRDLILESGMQLIGAVFSLHASGFFLGYVLSKRVHRDEKSARTISIEVGMQNSGLGVVLAQKNFANPAVAIPSAISSVFHSLLGSLLAAFWGRSQKNKKEGS